MAVQMPEIEFRFGTKAETLAALAPRLRRVVVPPMLSFEVSRWHAARDETVAEVGGRFGGRAVAVRSSARSEDGAQRSMAGAFVSCLDVPSDDPAAVAEAIDAVVDSYPGDPGDQLLIQEMVTDAAVSGVITTHVMEDGAPYYVLNYDDFSGRTDTITGGIGANKTVMIHRDALPEMVESDRVRAWLSMTREIERICGEAPLDLEFAQSGTGELYLLQARQISVRDSWDPELSEKVSTALRYIESFIGERSKPRAGLFGSRTILGEMPDWNPAEIIGTSPRPLATALYRYLVTDRVWRQARGEMGYRNPGHEMLMVRIGGRPYVDVRNSFNSFLPAELSAAAGTRLVDAWLDRLDAHPELHDKIEFEIAQTAIDFRFDEVLEERYPGVLSHAQTGELRRSLRTLTLRAVAGGSGGTLERRLGDIEALAGYQAERRLESWRDLSPLAKLSRIGGLLEECRDLGTLPFSVIARHAFIAEALLRSAVARGALTSGRLDLLRRATSTVTSEMAGDVRRVCLGDLTRSDFLRRYGHLRPGTYDILSARYDQMPALFEGVVLPEAPELAASFELSAAERRDLAALLAEAGLGEVQPDGLIRYARAAIVGRERAKFVFTRSLSDALELLAQWGEEIGLSRADVSYLELEPILRQTASPILGDRGDYFRHLAARGREDASLTRGLHLGYLVRDPHDLYVIPLHRAAPNYVTGRRISGRAVFIDSRTTRPPDLYGSIVCIENADPGFDWIFTRGIAGLVTQFGGSNSHMAIRCAELGLPAAIGCGEQTFRRIVRAGQVELNCGERLLRPLHG